MHRPVTGRGRVEVRVEPPVDFNDGLVTVVAEVVGTPSPADGITITVGPPGRPGVVRLEYPMDMVDPQMVALAQHMLGKLTR